MTGSLIMTANGMLLAGVFFYTFWPNRVSAARRERARLNYLLECKEQVFENLNDLNFEYKAGNYSEFEYEAQRTKLGEQAEHLLVEIIDLQREDNCEQ
jgi:hypothetical protein